MNSVIFAPDGPVLQSSLLRVKWDPEKRVFVMYSTSGYSRNSTITDVESVSYVSSPWIPKLFRRSGRETTDNAGLVGILESAKTNIKDELNEVVNLDELKVFFGEWIPMGANQIVALNDRLGSSERVQVWQKHHLTGPCTCMWCESNNKLATDSHLLFLGRLHAGRPIHGGSGSESSDEQLPGRVNWSHRGARSHECCGINPHSHEDLLLSCVAPTQVRVLDYDEPRYVNFEAEVHFPEEEGIVQIENFGVHINEEGFLAFGMTVDGIMDRYARPIILIVICTIFLTERVFKHVIES